ncbi:MAG: zinc-dependent metalloprotease [Solirubrobacterales bacterium]|nr:zinc-dependent metalloprotease [Solirubrobacterales bacterium]
MLDQALTQRIAGLVAGADGSATALPGDLAALCADAERDVVAYTGMRPAAGLPSPEAVGRPAWIAANVATMDTTLEPVAARVGEGLGPLGAPARAAVGMVVSVEAGALMGYLSQRVLGQYELALLDPARTPRLLFVAPNITAAARRMEVDEAQLLAWIALHEVTHAVQFGSVGWLRDHVAGLLGELLASLELTVDARALLRLPGRDDLRALVDAVREGGLVSAFAGPERQGILDRLQVVMAVVEGHAEHVMDVVGARTLQALPELRAALDRRRRERPPLLALLDRLIGLESKLRQYEDGKRFCDAVVAAAGPAALHRVFDAPERLPTLAELDDPGAWIRRTGVRAVTP